MRVGRVVAAASVVVGLVVGAVVVVASPGSAVATKMFARLTGAQEVPGPGDPNGSGAAVFTNNPPVEKFCVDLGFRNIEPPTAMHIHRGVKGEFGDVVINLAPVLAGTRCVTASTELLREIRNNPAGFYINIHTADFEGGAIRGQLEPSQF